VYHVPRQERYKGVNYYCQGCAGNVLKMWWLKMREQLAEGDYVFLTVHDELDMAILRKGGKRQAKRRVKRYCDAARDIDLFTLPIVAEPSQLCENWGECE
jgi:DNA polymerase I-like protein with 3'-5' exonuclease and polymerase domains